MRKAGGGSQLSQEGVNLARTLGGAMGPFAQVVASVVPRARETAIAMGFAVDYEMVTLVHDEDFYREAEASRWWDAVHPFSALASLLDAKGATWRHAPRNRRIMARYPYWTSRWRCRTRHRTLGGA